MPSDTDALSEAIIAIQSADRPYCLERWREVFGRSPPKHLSPRFIKRVLIWEVQCRMLGGVSAKTERALKGIAAGKSPPVYVKPGAHLIREWNGRTYQVEVTEDGFVMDGNIYKSLSAIAHRITGTQWSGPRFFGLT